MLRVAVTGATGRMGAAVVRAVAAAEDAQLVGAATIRTDPGIGRDAGLSSGVEPLDVAIRDSLESIIGDCDVVIDFTLPAATDSIVDLCAAAGCPLVMGTTGLSAQQMAKLRESAEKIPVVYGRNMSVGVNVFIELARLAAAYLGTDFEIEIMEAHHRNKIDAPSGTALQLAEAVAGERGADIGDVLVHGRKGSTGPRDPMAIGMHAIRAGSIVGEHSILLAADEELIELRHRALDRATFAVGALRAARWCIAKPPGYYTMADVLGIAH